MATPERKGYFWNYYGFTKLHLWGSHLTGGFFASVGTLLLIVPIGLWNVLPDRIFIRLLLVSIACFAAATTIAVGSILSLVFFWGSSQQPSGSPSDEPPKQPQA